MFSCVKLQLLGLIIGSIMPSSDEGLSSDFYNVDSDGNAIAFCIQQLSDVRLVTVY
jgi:hypothetical protein